MKSSIHLRLLSILTLLFSLGWTTNAVAQGTGTKDDPYVMVDGGEYTYTVFKDFYGIFVVPEDVTTDGVVLELVADQWTSVFADKEMNELVSVTTGNFAPYTSTVDIKKGTKKGTTYYVYTDFPMDEGKVRVSYGGGTTLELVNVTPADGSVLSASENYIGIEFSKPVRFTQSVMVIGGKEYSVVSNQTDRFISIEPKEVLLRCYESGALKQGDEILLILKEVKTYDGKSSLGDVVVRYKAASKPLMLVSSINGPDTGMPKIKSWMSKTCTEGWVRLIFDGKLNKNAKLKATLTYGDLELEGDYYIEELSPEIINDNTIAIDLRGKLRIPSQMVASGTFYDNMLLSVRGVEDENGFSSYAEGSGSSGTYFFTYGYEMVSYGIMTEFMPASGQSIDNVKEITIWMQETGSRMAFNGAAFEYVHEGETKVAEVAQKDITITPDDEEETATYITIPVPSFSRDANTQVKVTLKNAVYPDGMDYASYVTAIYTTKGYEVPTSIDSIKISNKTTVYTLDGKVAKLPLKVNSLYIINGKKTLVK